MKDLRFSSIALLAIVALFAAACESPQQTETPGVVEQDTTDVWQTEEMDAQPGTVGDADVTVEETNNALEQGVENIPLTDAQQNVNGWIARLQNTDDFENRDAIVADLERLRDALGQSPIDGARVGELLTNLGQNTSEAGTAAANASVQRLGQLLSQAGARLAGN